ncbi:molybdopterin-guanine dinucleotide biosynthesis protein B [Lagierella sp.]|uniref:molybdopterin-guanine dinucleotide biosynthesis protein B n=1 Tax=Lagierella sp. TaxID=2849657 RepID=UPI00260ADAB8|nr:molybdopterin-guanine dinucleotide biosynthesis protein B [Lagierella sp.]
MEITVGILAGGRSKRMGVDKTNLIYNGSTFLDNLLYKFKDYDIIVSSNKTDLDLPNVEIVRDNYSDIGPISGILEILKASKNEYVFIVGIDMQLIDADILEFLKTYISAENKLICLDDHGKTNPLGAIYSRSLVKKIQDNIELEDFRLMDLLSKDYTKIVPISFTRFSPDIMSNINYPSQYKALTNGNIISICGAKNSGKTTFISKVIRQLNKEGYLIKYIKHDGHDFTLENLTDSNIIYNSGAFSSVVYSSSKYELIERQKKDIDFFLQDAKKYDFVIIEGLKNSSFPKFEVIRNHNTNQLISQEPILGIITDFTNRFNEKKHFDLNNILEFTNYIKENYLMEKRS